MLARFPAFAIALVLLVPAHAADDTAGEKTIKNLLTKPKSWTLYYDHTDSPTPTDRVTRMTFAYFERDGKLMSPHVLEFGGCELEVSLRNDGFSFRWCPPLEGAPSLTYDPNDSQYPFKNLREPRRMWLKANE